MASNGKPLPVGTRVRFILEQDIDGTIVDYWRNSVKVVIGYIVRPDDDPTKLLRVPIKGKFRVLRI